MNSSSDSMEFNRIRHRPLVETSRPLAVQSRAPCRPTGAGSLNSERIIRRDSLLIVRRVSTAESGTRVAFKTHTENRCRPGLPGSGGKNSDRSPDMPRTPEDARHPRAGPIPAFVLPSSPSSTTIPNRIVANMYVGNSPGQIASRGQAVSGTSNTKMPAIVRQGMILVESTRDVPRRTDPGRKTVCRPDAGTNHYEAATVRCKFARNRFLPTSPGNPRSLAHVRPRAWPAQFAAIWRSIGLAIESGS